MKKKYKYYSPSSREKFHLLNILFKIQTLANPYRTQGRISRPPQTSVMISMTEATQADLIHHSLSGLKNKT